MTGQPGELRPPAARPAAPCRRPRRRSGRRPREARRRRPAIALNVSGVTSPAQEQLPERASASAAVSSPRDLGEGPGRTRRRAAADAAARSSRAGPAPPAASGARTQPAGILCATPGRRGRGPRCGCLAPGLEHGPDDLARQPEADRATRADNPPRAGRRDPAPTNARGERSSPWSRLDGRRARPVGPGEPVIGMQVMTPEQHRRELLRRRQPGRGKPARVHLPRRWTSFQHRDVHVTVGPGGTHGSSRRSFGRRRPRSGAPASGWRRRWPRCRDRAAPAAGRRRRRAGARPAGPPPTSVPGHAAETGAAEAADPGARWSGLRHQPRHGRAVSPAPAGDCDLEPDGRASVARRTRDAPQRDRPAHDTRLGRRSCVPLYTERLRRATPSADLRRSGRACRSRARCDLREHYPFGLVGRLPRAELARHPRVVPATKGKPTIVATRRGRSRHVARG